jgi:ADP-ribose pyrophosphatase YjhB (NUDIX family)
MDDERLRPRCLGCGFVFYREFGVGACVLVVDGDRVLLCRRAFGGNEGKWCFPGGHVEFDEDWLTAAIREAKEESGLEIEIVALHTVVCNFFGPRRHTIVVVPLARVIGGYLAPDGREIDEVGWFSATELPDLAFEAERHIIERYFAAPFAGAPVDPRYAR